MFGRLCCHGSLKSINLPRILLQHTLQHCNSQNMSTKGPSTRVGSTCVRKKCQVWSSKNEKIYTSTCTEYAWKHWGHPPPIFQSRRKRLLLFCTDTLSFANIHSHYPNPNIHSLRLVIKVEKRCNNSMCTQPRRETLLFFAYHLSSSLCIWCLLLRALSNATVQQQQRWQSLLPFDVVQICDALLLLPLQLH